MSQKNDQITRLGNFLPYLLSVTSNAVSNCIAQEYHARFGLKITEWRVMALLGEIDSATQRELADKTLMDKVAVNRACKSLEDRALAHRIPNARDGRSHHLELTAAGQGVYEDIMPLAEQMERQLFTALSADEQAQFRALLGRIRKQADEFGQRD
ncbi:MarR family transcriptional regulator [Altererythrobacter sp. ZODW24]|uniref:MarR family winged helix-turn-helix transcriptional regulator n=1 Tax=Altererythrobacter sp. ZODW24 TaxID=2185142 RepID=UPI000DF7E545|nr:MarR family transcriptional regulator [Altererythrobacter sp. ZODW24]